MSKTTELLLARQAEIEAEVAPLKAELKEINAALAAIEGKTVRVRKRLADLPQSIADQALQVLKNNPQGLRTREIAAKIREAYNRDIKSRNMSWHMSRLKSDSHVELVGENWRLPPDKDEAPDSEESGASEHHDDEGGTSSSSGNGVGPTVVPLGAIPAHPGE